MKVVCINWNGIYFKRLRIYDAEKAKKHDGILIKNIGGNWLNFPGTWWQEHFRIINDESDLHRHK